MSGLAEAVPGRPRTRPTDWGAALHGGEGGAPQDTGTEQAPGPWLLGVRHHGPGSARAVRDALDACAPRVVLIEGPPEADALVALAGDAGMSPPVALLAHVTDDPARSTFWPLAEFSPEWVAIRWAVERGVPARFIDLPAAHSLAQDPDPKSDPESKSKSDESAAPQAARSRPGPETGTGPAFGGPPDPGVRTLDVDRGTLGEATLGGVTVGTEVAAPCDGTPNVGSRAPDGNTALDEATAEADSGAPYDGSPDADHVTPPDRGFPPDHANPSEHVTPPDRATPPDHGSPADHRTPQERRTRQRRRTPRAHRTGGSVGDLRIDPLAVLAETAGYDDPERWWEDVVEHRGAGDDALAPFAALADAMGALRERYGDVGHARDAVREAYMRLQLRAARKEFGDQVAVVCGAWHVPALAARSTVSADRALLKGLPRAKVDMTWVPWTHRRLSRSSGYGAGIASPGWYAHLFRAPDRPVERWMTKVAGLLRDEDRTVSSAHVIEAVRLAETLAALRGRPLPGLSETTDAIRAVMCEGSDVPLSLVHDKLVVGDVLGEVPPSAPAVPLQRDLTRTQRTLRLKPAAAERELELDLRKDTDAARSRLLHRLRLLRVDWGEPAAGSRGSTGTFRETWRLRWEPELAVRVAEAGVWGTTVLAAATVKAETDAIGAPALADVTALAEHCLLAGLPDALPTVMRVLMDRAALDADVGHLAQALPALVRSLCYGDVRGTDTGALAEVAAGLAERVFVGLPPACAALDAEGAARMRGHVDAVHTAVGLLADASAHDIGIRGRWHAVLRALGARDTVPGEVRGRAVRLLLDAGELADEEAARLMGLALSSGAAPADAAAWIEGFVGSGAGGGGMLLVHDERLLGLVDGWLTGVPGAAFTDVLPLLRRTFSAYETGVRRTLGELVRRGPGGGPGAAATTAGVPGFAAEPDQDRADAVLPVLHLILGLDAPPAPATHDRPGAPV